MSDKEIEYYVKNYEKWLESRNKLSGSFLGGKYYVSDCKVNDKLRKLEQKVKSFIQAIYKHHIFVKSVYKGKRGIGYTIGSRTRLLYPKKTYGKFVKGKLICNLNRNSRNLILGYLMQIEKSFNSKWMYYLKFDISLYYPSLKKEVLIKVIEKISKIFYGNKTNKAKEIIKLIEKSKHLLFVDGRFVLFFEDDFLIFYKKLSGKNQFEVNMYLSNQVLSF